ncbi:MAG: ATP-binding protein [Pirellulales bacterium]
MRFRSRFAPISSNGRGVARCWGSLGILDLVCAVREIQESRRKFELLVESLDGIVWEIDVENFEFTFVSRQAERILGYPLEDWYRTGFWVEHIHPEDRDLAFMTCMNAISEGRNHVFEYRMLAADGRIVWIHDYVTVKNENDRPVMIGGFMTDATSRKNIAAQTELLREELAHVSRLVTMGELAAGLAHELNQPLAALNNFAEAAIRLGVSVPNERLRNCLKRIGEQSLCASDIVRRMRSFAARKTLVREPENPNRLIQGVLDLLGNDLRQNGVALDLLFCEPAPRILADGVQIQQVVVNLIRNAIDALSDIEHGKRLLRVRTHADERTVRVEIADNGPGIAQEMAPLIFHPFQSTKTSGLGLGLAISRTLIEAHGGSIDARTNPSGGAIVTFTLPIGELSGVAPA